MSSEEKEWWGDEGESWKTGSAAKKRRMAIYVEWLLTPESERQPRLKKDLADELGVTTATLRNYTRDPWLQRELAERARSEAKVDQLPEVIQSLYVQAKDPENPRSVQASKVILDWLERTEENRTVESFDEMSDDDLASLTRELLERMSRNE